jgi:drug/metabolite transporter (DMT)-like permease
VSPTSPHSPQGARPRAAAFLLLAPVILLWALNPLLVPDLSRSYPVPEINFLASACALVVLALGVTIGGRWRVLGSWSPGEWGGALLLGAVGMFPYSSLYFLAFSLAPESAGATNIINYLWPIWTVLLSALILKERLHWTGLLGLCLSFAGVYVLVSHGRFVELDRAAAPAYLAAGTGAFFWGLFSTLGKRRQADPLCSMLVYTAGACACFGGLALAVGGMRPPSGGDWARIALLGGGSNGIAYLLWVLALKRGETGRIASLAYLVPLVALLYLRLFRGTPVTTVHLVALVLVIAGPLVQLVRPRPAVPAKGA